MALWSIRLLARGLLATGYDLVTVIAELLQCSIILMRNDM